MKNLGCRVGHRIEILHFTYLVNVYGKQYDIIMTLLIVIMQCTDTNRFNMDLLKNIFIWGYVLSLNLGHCKIKIVID
jgi:hypothetical protein